MDDFGALARSGAELERRLRCLAPAGYARPSVCPGWSAGDLANHVVGGELRYWLRLRDDGPAAEATRDEDHIAGDPAGAYRRYAQPLEEEFRRPGALARVVPHRAGPRTGLQLLHMRIMERALHAWDLARTLGVDDTLDEELVQVLLRVCPPLVAELRGTGFYREPLPDGGPAALPMAALLRLTGRDPAARPGGPPVPGA